MKAAWAGLLAATATIVLAVALMAHIHVAGDAAGALAKRASVLESRLNALTDSMNAVAEEQARQHEQSAQDALEAAVEANTVDGQTKWVELEGAEATFYTASEEEGTADGVTATGTLAKEGRTCAVDPSVIPLGSRVTVFFEDTQEKWELVAEDVGGAVKGSLVDVYVEDVSTALSHGGRTKEVRIWFTE